MSAFALLCATFRAHIADTLDHTSHIQLVSEFPFSEFQVAAFKEGTCALTNSNVVCWGGGVVGTNGNGATNDLNEPLSQPIHLGAYFEAKFIDCGSYHCCATSQKNDSKCWGWNVYGQLGQGDTNNRGDQEGQMGDNLKIIELGSDFIIDHLSCGGGHTCALSTENKIKCFGWNEYGQLGYEHTDNIGDQQNEMGDDISSVDLGSDFEPIQVECGATISCAVSVNFQVKCWGDNGQGQLGQGDIVTRGATTDTMGDGLAVINLGANFSAVDIHCGASHVCALSAGKDIKCWGYGIVGQLGLGDRENRGDDGNEMGDWLPSVDLGSDFIPQILSTGSVHTLSVSVDGSLKTWGYGSYGQLGHGDIYTRGWQQYEMGVYLPSVDLGMGSGSYVFSASNGNQNMHTCVWLINASYVVALKCFGLNDYGQLGVGDEANRGDESGEMGDFLEIVLEYQLNFTAPTVEPSTDPTAAPTRDPTNYPTNIPTMEPSVNPTSNPTVEPSLNPTAEPTIGPSMEPTYNPTVRLSTEPTLEPTITTPTDSTDGDVKESSPRLIMSFDIMIGCIIAGIVCISILCYVMMRAKCNSDGRNSNERAIELQQPPTNQSKKRMEMSRGLIANIAIGEYDENETKSDVDVRQLDVDAVVNDLRQFADDFGYEYMSMDDKTYWTEQEILSFLRDDVGNAYFDETGRAKYDGLILCVTGRGDERNVLSSDHQPMDKVAIHRIISNKYATIRDFPRIFIFDSCASMNKHASTTSMRTQNALLTTSNGLTTQHVVAASSGELSEWMEKDDIKENDTGLANDVGKATTLEDVRGKYEWTSSNNNPDYNLVTLDAVGQMFVPNAVHCFLERVRQNAENQEKLGMTDVMDKVKADLDLQSASTFVHVLNNKTRTMVIRKNNRK